MFSALIGRPPTETTPACHYPRSQSTLFHKPLPGHDKTGSEYTASAEAKAKPLRQEYLIVLRAETQHAQREDAEDAARDEDGRGAV